MTMKVLMINKFFYLKGGSERVFFNEADLLERNGHQVLFFSMHHDKNIPSPCGKYFVDTVDYDIPGNVREKISRSLKIIYSREARQKITALLEAEKPDIAHLHNIHHQISPSIIPPLNARSIPVVMTLHDYKMVCPTYALVREGRICEKCRGGRYFWCLLHRCTKGSYGKSLVNMIEMYYHHWFADLYGGVDTFIAPSRFLQEKIRDMGFPGRVVNLPYPIDSADYEPASAPSERILCYLGRLSAEKGLETLLAAMKGADAVLHILGDGPLKGRLEEIAERDNLSNVSFLGYKSGDELKQEIRSSRAVIVPSEWYENYPNSVMEAFALGKPVIGAKIGGIPEMVRDGETGWIFEPGNATELRRRIELLLSDQDAAVVMGRKARSFVEEELNPGKHYRELMEVYQAALERNHG